MKLLCRKNIDNICLWVLLILCLFGTFAGCSDDKDVKYVTDTHLSILQESRKSLVYLLDHSTYGTTPGTYPIDGKEILNNAIAKLDASIDKVKEGEMVNDSDVETILAEVSQAIDAFKETRLYNLSETAQAFIKQLNEKASELITLLDDESLWGDHKGQYPVASKTILQGAIDNLYSLSERAQSGSIANFTQELFNDAMQEADEAMQQVEASKWTEDHVTWMLYVDGNNGGYIDFGYSDDYVKFGDNNNQAFTVELWVNIKEYCNQPGEDNGTILSTMTQQDYWSGWRVQDRTKGLLRTMVAHWEDQGPSNPKEWEPGWKKSDNWTQNRWTHYAFLFRDKGLPGFDTPTDVKCYSMIDGVRQGEMIRVGETWRTYINDNSVKYKVPMTGFCALDNNGNRKEWFSGYIKKIRIWKTNRTEDQIKQSYLGVEADVTADNTDLVAAWDFEVTGAQPTGTEFKDLTGRHIATLKGPQGSYNWVESAIVSQ
nr:DUF4972 domain-containing protein [uncultured Bacteroides sp.]